MLHVGHSDKVYNLNSYHLFCVFSLDLSWVIWTRVSGRNWVSVPGWSSQDDEGFGIYGETLFFSVAVVNSKLSSLSHFLFTIVAWLLVPCEPKTLSWKWSCYQLFAQYYEVSLSFKVCKQELLSSYATQFSFGGWGGGNRPPWNPLAPLWEYLPFRT